MPSRSSPRNFKGHTREQSVLGKDTHYNASQHSSLVAHSKRRRHYQMPSKVTISRPCDRHFNVTNGP